MKHEIKNQDVRYILDVSAGELAYLAHAVSNDKCHCGNSACNPPRDFPCELLDLVETEGIKY